MRWPVTAALLFAASVTAAASATPALPGVLTQGTPAFQVRPAVIGYTGDGTGIVGGADGTSARHPGHLRWTTYNTQEGVGHGLVWLDDCSPDCASGTFRATPVTVYVFAPKASRFQILTLTYSYRGTGYTDTRRIRHYEGLNGAPGYWEYYIASAV